MSADDNHSQSLVPQEVTEREEDNLYIITTYSHPDDLKMVIRDIQERLSVSDSLKIDISAMDNINFIAVQSFIAINHFARNHHKNLQWLSPHDKFMDTFSKLGLYSEMMKMEFIA